MEYQEKIVYATGNSLLGYPDKYERDTTKNKLIKYQVI